MLRLINKSALMLIVFLCLPLTGCKLPFHDDAEGSSSDRSTNTALEDIKIVFDWNEQSDSAICSAIEVNNNLLSLGATFTPRNNAKNTKALDQLEDYLVTYYGDALRIVNREARLSILNIELTDCTKLNEIRSLKTVKYVEPRYLSPIDEGDIFDGIIASQTKALSIQQESSEDENEEEPENNPGLYDPRTTNQTYDRYIRDLNDKSADIMKRHNITRIYDDYDHYGQPNIGVAVLDNGVVEERMDFFGQGNGYYEAMGYYRPFSLTNPFFDGASPKKYDLYGITSQIDSIFEHGTRQTERVYMIAPNVNIVSVRAAPFVVWFLPTAYQGVTESIMAMAENPDIRIISNSMGTVIHVHEIERAIDYFNAYDKLFISAAGTTVPVLKDFVRIVFPANLPSTISTTGLADTKKTGGKFVLGEAAHGGLENDFVVDHSSASSESVSTSAGMIALLWSANPSLSRTELLDILIKSSSNYRSKRKKDPVFGWGKIDMYRAYQDIIATRD